MVDFIILLLKKKLGAVVSHVKKIVGISGERPDIEVRYLSKETNTFITANIDVTFTSPQLFKAAFMRKMKKHE